MKGISPVTISKLIEAHFSNNESKFIDYVSFIIGKLEERGDIRGARIIRDKLYYGYIGKYTEVVLDDGEFTSAEVENNHGRA